MLQHCDDVTLLEPRIASPPCSRLAALTYSAFNSLDSPAVAASACSRLSAQVLQWCRALAHPRRRQATTPGRRLLSSSEVVRCWPRSPRSHAERQCARMRRTLDSRVRIGAMQLAERERLPMSPGRWRCGEPVPPRPAMRGGRMGSRATVGSAVLGRACGSTCECESGSRIRMIFIIRLRTRLMALLQCARARTRCCTRGARARECAL